MKTIFFVMLSLAGFTHTVDAFTGGKEGPTHGEAMDHINPKPYTDDFDEDGIIDDADLDDDNDGVPDRQEGLKSCSECLIPAQNEAVGQFLMWDIDNGALTDFGLARGILPSWANSYFTFIQETMTISGMTAYHPVVTGSPGSLTEAVNNSDYIQVQLTTSCNFVYFDYVNFYFPRVGAQVRIDISTDPSFNTYTTVLSDAEPLYYHGIMQLATDYLMLPLTTYYIREYWAGFNGSEDPAPGFGFRCPTDAESLLLPFIDIDTDEDGVPNRLDVDSDADGCSDAFESGATTSTDTDYMFAGPDANSNGLNDYLEASPDGAINYPSTYRPHALDSSLTACRPIMMPLKLLSFTIKKTEATRVCLEWQTTEEKNTEYFAVERSANGHVWQQIGTVRATMKPGNNKYLYDDPSGCPGVNFYRLRMVDTDGKYTFSPIRSLSIDIELTSISVYPNPAKDVVTIRTDQGELFDCTLFDLTGKELTSRVTITRTSRQLVVMQIKNLPPGIYAIKYAWGVKLLQKL